MFNLYWWSKKAEKKPVVKPVEQDEFNQTVTVRIVQVDEKDIHKYCSAGGACYKLIGGRHVIYIPKLKGETDYIGQQKLGHEMYHVLGMKH